MVQFGNLQELMSSIELEQAVRGVLKYSAGLKMNM